MASRRGFSRVRLRFFHRFDVLWTTNDVKLLRAPTSFPLYLMDLLGVIVVVHESAMDITEVETGDASDIGENVVDSETSSVSGSEASGEHDLRTAVSSRVSV